MQWDKQKGWKEKSLQFVAVVWPACRSYWAGIYKLARCSLHVLDGSVHPMVFHHAIAKRADSQVAPAS